MANELDIKSLVERAKERGCFDLSELQGKSLNISQFQELHTLLQRKKIPICDSDENKDTAKSLNRGEALGIIRKLRTGVPAGRHVALYSVGQESLLSDVRKDLTSVGESKSRVRFLNGDYGRGKSHALHLLREKAFNSDFVVSEVTLSPNDCPLHDFMRVYRDIMSGIRTKECPNVSAVENIMDRWLQSMRNLSEEQVKQIVYSELPQAIKYVLAAYYEAQSFLRPKPEKIQLLLKYLHGDQLHARDRKKLELTYIINEKNALHMLGQIANLVRYIGYKGLCILFDEAESTHSFAYYGYRDRAFQNLQKITQESKLYHHCYFLYATTPTFFNSYPNYSDVVELPILELEFLDKKQRLDICNRINEIYCLAYSWKLPSNSKKIVEAVEEEKRDKKSEIGDLVRAVVAALDELRRTK